MLSILREILTLIITTLTFTVKREGIHSLQIVEHIPPPPEIKEDANLLMMEKEPGTQEILEDVLGNVELEGLELIVKSHEVVEEEGKVNNIVAKEVP